MTNFVFVVTTELNGNTRTARRGVKAPDEHNARRQMVQYYLAKKARVVSIQLEAAV